MKNSREGDLTEISAITKKHSLSANINSCIISTCCCCAKLFVVLSVAVFSVLGATWKKRYDLKQSFSKTQHQIAFSQFFTAFSFSQLLTVKEENISSSNFTYTFWFEPSMIPTAIRVVNGQNYSTFLGWHNLLIRFRLFGRFTSKRCCIF